MFTPIYLFGRDLPTSVCALRRMAVSLAAVAALVCCPAQAVEPQGASAAASAEPRFDILEYVVDGNSRLDASTIETAVTPYLGERKTVRDVEAARTALEASYHKAGFLTVLVTIPEQRVDSGVVALHVVEAEIERLRVKGSEYHTLNGIKDRVPELAEGNVPNFPRMQEQLAEINHAADIKVTPVLRAGRVPGTVEALLDVEDQLPLHGTVELSNRQSPNTTATRLSASIRYDNLWQRGHSAGLSMQTSPENTREVGVLAASYMLPVGGGGRALSLYAVHSDSEFATIENAPGLGVLGQADIVGLRYAMPMPSSTEFVQSFSGGMDYKAIKQSVVVGSAGSVSTPITYQPLVAIYSANWLDKDHPTSLELTTTLGLRGFLQNKDSEFVTKRVGASANYTVLRAALQRTQTVGKWLLNGKLDAQLASGPLISNEQYSAGGSETVRGYLEGERSGDEAVHLSLNVRSSAVPLGGKGSDWQMAGLLFYEAAQLKLLQSVYPQVPVVNISSIGAGLRLSGPRGLGLDLDLARALEDGDITRAGDYRLHVRLVLDY